METTAQARPHTRTDLWLQTLILVLAAGIHLGCALSWFPGMDEYWHLYFGEIEPFSFFIDEVRKDTHPPATYLWLRALTHAGADPVFGRLSSILPSLATLPLVFLWLRGLSVQASLAHMATLLLALSTVYTTLGIVVRSYALATFATLLVFHLATPVLKDPRTLTRGRLALLLAALLAAPWSHYTAVLPLSVLVVLAVSSMATRRGALQLCWSRLRSLRPWPELTAFTAFALALPLYYRWTRPASLTGYLASHFPHEGQPAASFLQEAFARNLTMFLRVDLTSWPTLASALGLALVGYGVGRHAFPLRAPRDPARAMVYLTLGGVVCLLALLALGRLHPFGGEQRHQYVMAPFLWAALLLVADDFLRLLPRAVRIGGPILVAGLALLTARANFAAPMRDEFFRDRPLWQSEYQVLAQGIEPDAVLYTSTFSRVGLYGQARNDGAWRRSARHIVDGNRFDIVDGRLGRHQVSWVLGPRWTFALRPDENLKHDLSVLFEKTGRRRVWVVSLQEQWPSLDGSHEILQQEIATVLERQGWQLKDYLPLPRGHAYAIERQ